MADEITAGAAPRAPPAMCAAVLVGPGRAELRRVARPDPARGQVRLRVEGCGVCGSSLPLWEGRPWFGYPQPPGAPGHEAWGVVEALGEGVAGLREGDRVAFLGEAGFAEQAVIEEGAAVRLPAALADLPCPGEPLACAVNALRRSRIRPGQSVAVVGIGFLGGLLVQLAARRGARVVAVSRRPFARALALRMGAAAAVPFAEVRAAVDAACDCNGGALFDCVVEAVGLQAPLDLAGELCRERGRLVVVGFHQDGPRRVDLQLWNWRGLDVVNAHERSPAAYVDGLRRAVAALAEGALDPGPLLTHRFPLARLGDAFEAARTRPEGFLKALVLP